MVTISVFRPWHALVVVNLSASVTLVIIMKYILTRTSFNCPLLLTSFHFITNWCAVATLHKCSARETVSIKRESYKYLLFWAVLTSVGISLMNVALQMLPIAVFQILKLGMAPLSASLYFVFFDRRLSRVAFLSVFVIMCGLVVTQIPKLDGAERGAPFTGVAIGIGAVFVCCLEQMLIGELSYMLALSATDFCREVMHVAGLITFVMGIVKGELASLSLTLSGDTLATLLLCGTCVCALALNLTNFMLLAKFSAVTAQVIGYTKAISILILGWWIFPAGESDRFFEIIGVCIALPGIAAYTLSASRDTANRVSQADTNTRIDALIFGCFFKFALLFVICARVAFYSSQLRPLYELCANKGRTWSIH